MTSTTPCPPCDAIDDDNDEEDDDDDSISIQCSLDLPDSFDDTLDLSVVLGSSGSGTAQDQAKQQRCTGIESSASHVQSSQQQPQSQTEVKILRSKLQEAASTIASLRSQLQGQKSSMQQDIDKIDDTECQYLSRLPPQELTLVQFTALTIHGKVAALRKELECQQRKAKNTTDIAEQDLKEAARAKELAERRIGSTEEELRTYQERNEELQSTVRKLQDQVLETKEKGRKYDAACQRATNAVAETDDLRRAVESKSTDLQEASNKEKELRKKLVDCEKMIQALEVDKTFLHKENAILVERAEQSEKGFAEQEPALREALHKNETLKSELFDERAANKASYETKLLLETKKIREECDKEIQNVKRGVDGSCDREFRMLKDTRDDAIHQKEQLQHELTQLRQSHEALICSHAKITADAEREIANARSDVKIKTYENANLIEARQVADAEFKRIQEQTINLQDQLQSSKQDLAQLRLESDVERKKLQSEIAKKEEQLETYLQIEFQVDSKIEAGKDPGKMGRLSCPKRRLEQAMMLAKQCADLKRVSAALQSNLKSEKEANVALKRAVSQMKQPSAYAVQLAKKREEELIRLKAENECLERSLSSSKKEKRQLQDVLNKRQQLEEMKELIQDLKDQQSKEQSNPPAHHHRTSIVKGMPIKNDPLCLHTVHHASLAGTR